MEQPVAPLELTDFSGGETDTPLSANINQYEIAQNLLITKNKKLEGRPGSTFYSSDVPQYSDLRTRINNLIFYKNDLLAFTNKKAFYDMDGVKTEIQDPDGGSVFDLGNEDTLTSLTEWNSHILASDDSYSAPMKVFRGNGLAGAISLANDLKDKFNQHIADATVHDTPDGANTVTAADATDFPSLVTLALDLRDQYTDHNDDANLAAAWVYHHGQADTENTLDDPDGVLTNIDDVIALLNDIKAKYTAHYGDSGSHNAGPTYPVATSDASEPFFAVRAGLPTPTAPTVTPSGSGTSYGYAFVYKYEYTIGDTTYIDRSAPIYVTDVDGAASLAGSSNAITAIPALSGRYDTTRIVIEIYRTEGNGTAFFYLGEVANGVTTFDDDNDDSALNELLPLYTEGDVPERTPPPPAKYVHTVNGITLWCGVYEEGVVYKNKFRQSIPNAPAGCPEDFYDFVDDEITGVSSIGSNHIIFTKQKAYRIDSYFDELGRGSITKTVISETRGCISNNSVVQMSHGLAFASVDGFYFTDGQRTDKISDLRNQTYKLATHTDAQKRLVFGAYDKITECVYWAVQLDESSPDCDYIFVWDTRWGIQRDGVFTHWTGTTDFSPTALLFKNGDLIRGHRYGYVFKHSALLYNDLIINVSLSESDWAQEVVPFDFKSAGLNFGSDSIRKWVTKLTVLCQSPTNLTAALYSYNDQDTDPQVLDGIRFRSSWVWGDEDLVWGDPTLTWNYYTLIREKRRMAKTKLRCTYKAIELTNADATIYRSDDYATADAVKSSGAITLGGGQFWPTSVLGYEIAFDTDDYETRYPIVSRDSSTQISIAANALDEDLSSAKWQIMGKKRNEKLYLQSLTFDYVPLSNSHNSYDGVTGDNA